MTKVSELISSNIENALINYQTWNGILFYVKSYGAKGDGTDETPNIQKTINAAVANNSRNVYFSPGTYVASALDNLDLVDLIGDNATLTVGGISIDLSKLGQGSQKAYSLYSRAISESSVVTQVSMSQAKNAVQSKTVNVVVVGTSISYGADQSNPADTYAERFKIEMYNALYGSTVNYSNFAIPGNGLGQFVNPAYIPYGTISWATTPGQAWWDYVKNSFPDLLIIEFGMNDSVLPGAGKTFADNLALFKTYTETWAKVPSIVLVTTMLPTKNPAYYNQTQILTLEVARAAREFCYNNGWALADANRLFQILRDGLDDVTRAATTETFASKSFRSPYWLGSLPSFDIVGNSLIPKPGTVGKFVTRNRLFYNGTIPISFNPVSLGDIAWHNYRDDLVTGFGRLSLLAIAGTAGTGQVLLFYNNTQLAASANFAIAAGVAHSIIINAVGSKHTITVDGVVRLTYTGYECLHDGVVSFGSDGVVPTFTDLNISYEDPITADPPYTELDLLGPYNVANQSGNGINHPTGLGHALIYQPTLYGVLQQLSSVYGNVKKTIALQSSWITFTSPTDSAGYYKDDDGFIHLTGLIKDGITTADTLLFTLQSGDRPEGNIPLQTVSTDGTNYYPCTIWFYVDGTVKIGFCQPSTWISLGGLAPLRATYP